MKLKTITKASGGPWLPAALSALALTVSCPAFTEGYGWVSVLAVMVVTSLIAVLEER